MISKSKDTSKQNKRVYSSVGKREKKEERESGSSSQTATPRFTTLLYKASNTEDKRVALKEDGGRWIMGLGVGTALKKKKEKKRKGSS
jgi:hypothetical protein